MVRCGMAQSKELRLGLHSALCSSRTGHPHKVVAVGRVHVAPGVPMSFAAKGPMTPTPEWMALSHLEVRQPHVNVCWSGGINWNKLRNWEVEERT